MCREFVGNFEISKFLSGINLNLGPKMREFGRFSSGHTDRGVGRGERLKISILSEQNQYHVFS